MKQVIRDRLRNTRDGELDMPTRIQELTDAICFWLDENLVPHSEPGEIMWNADGKRVHIYTDEQGLRKTNLYIDVQEHRVSSGFRSVATGKVQAQISGHKVPRSTNYTAHNDESFAKMMGKVVELRDAAVESELDAAHQERLFATAQSYINRALSTVPEKSYARTLYRWLLDGTLPNHYNHPVSTVIIPAKNGEVKLEIHIKLDITDDEQTLTLMHLIKALAGEVDIV